MKKWRASFSGCTKGAIGIKSLISTVVEGETKEEASLRLYDKYEHISSVQLLAVFKLLPSETIMPDDHNVFPDYVYIVDGRFQRASDIWEVMTIAQWKQKNSFKEVRRCELFSHNGARLGDMVEP